MTGELIARRIGGTEAVRVAGAQGREVRADEREDGTIDSAIKGTGPQGEADSLRVCRILIAKLNGHKVGNPWQEPVCGTEPYIDCQTSDGTMALLIQVTRAEQAPEIWKSLNVTGEAVSSSRSYDVIADSLRDAIDRKPPSAGGPRMLLAIDATLTPGFTFSAVIDSFRLRHDVWARGRFSAIWIVGPNAELTKQLC